MKKLYRIIFGIILIALGIGVIAFGASLLFYSQAWMTYVFFGSASILGISIMAGGWAITRGAKIRDILETLIISLR